MKVRYICGHTEVRVDTQVGRNYINMKLVERCMHAWMDECAYVCMHLCMYACMYVQ